MGEPTCNVISQQSVGRIRPSDNQNSINKCTKCIASISIATLTWQLPERLPTCCLYLWSDTQVIKWQQQGTCSSYWNKYVAEIPVAALSCCKLSRNLKQIWPQRSAKHSVTSCALRTISCVTHQAAINPRIAIPAGPMTYHFGAHKNHGSTE